MATPRLSTAPDAAPQLEMPPQSPDLRDAVDEFWLMPIRPAVKAIGPATIFTKSLMVLGSHGLSDASEPGFPGDFNHQLRVPDGTLDVLVHLPYRESVADAPTAGRAYGVVLMPMRHTVNAAFHIPSITFGIRFHPGAARSFFPRSMRTLADCILPLEELWGDDAIAFTDEMSQSIEITELAPIAERHLLAHMSPPGEHSAIVRRCVAMLKTSGGNLPLEELQELTGMTERHLERLFREYVGASPKRLARTLRMNYLVKAVRNLDSVDWHDLIVTLNYCDQPHMIREFKDFIGMSPATFREKLKGHVERKKKLAELQNGLEPDA